MNAAARALLAALTIAVLGLSACGGRDGEQDQEQLISSDDEVEALDPALASRLPPGTTMEMAEEGRRQFLVCSVCHGLDAGGTELGPSLRDSEWIDISGEMSEIEAVIRSGVAAPKEYPIPMPVMGGGDFTDEQIRALATYVYILSHGTP